MVSLGEGVDEVWDWSNQRYAGFTQSQRIGVTVGCGLAVSVFGGGVR